MNSNFYILPYELENIKNGILFYPSSGADVKDPFNYFLPWVSSYYFIDPCYSSKSRILKNFEFELNEFNHFKVSGRTIKTNELYEIDITHYKSFIEDNEKSIYLCRGRGYDAFRSIIKEKNNKLSIFFYRGDSQGESGSGFYWLRKNRLRNILPYIEDGGIIVTDGSNSTSKLELTKFSRNNEITGLEGYKSVRSFDFFDHYFKCIGHINNRYGPTLIWKIKKGIV